MSFSSKKKERVRPRFLPDALQRGAISWQVVLDDSGQAALVDCYLGISTDTLVLIEERSREIVFVMPCKAILGWSTQTNRYGVICIEIMRFFVSSQLMNFLHLQMYLTFSPWLHSPLRNMTFFMTDVHSSLLFPFFLRLFILTHFCHFPKLHILSTIVRSLMYVVF